MLTFDRTFQDLGDGVLFWATNNSATNKIVFKATGEGLQDLRIRNGIDGDPIEVFHACRHELEQAAERKYALSVAAPSSGVYLIGTTELKL